MLIKNLYKEPKTITIKRGNQSVQAIVPKGLSQFLNGDTLTTNDPKIKAKYPRTVAKVIADATIVEREGQSNSKKSGSKQK